MKVDEQQNEVKGRELVHSRPVANLPDPVHELSAWENLLTVSNL